MSVSSSATNVAITAHDGAEDILITAAQLKRRWGQVSDMFLWRKLRDDPNFPRPLLMGGKNSRRFWYLSEIVAYERTLIARKEMTDAAS
jgi:predicted DNA-binding transcriptional regulator AlpA